MAICVLHFRRENDDVMVRVCAFSFLSRLDPHNAKHQTFVISLIRDLIVIQRDLLLVNSYKQFTNSLSHRHKHRVFTALLILEPFTLLVGLAVAKAIVKKFLNCTIRLLLCVSSNDVRRHCIEHTHADVAISVVLKLVSQTSSFFHMPTHIVNTYCKSVFGYVLGTQTNVRLPAGGVGARESAVSTRSGRMADGAAGLQTAPARARLPAHPSTPSRKGLS